MEQTTNRCEKNLHEQLSYVQEKCKTSFTCTTKLVDLLNLPKQFVKISSHDKNIFLYVCACIFTYMCICIRICWYVDMNVCVYMRVYVCIFVCMCFRTTFMCVCVCICLCMYVCIMNYIAYN